MPDLSSSTTAEIARDLVVALMTAGKVNHLGDGEEAAVLVGKMYEVVHKAVAQARRGRADSH